MTVKRNRFFSPVDIKTILETPRQPLIIGPDGKRDYKSHLVKKEENKEIGIGPLSLEATSENGNFQKREAKLRVK